MIQQCGTQKANFSNISQQHQMVIWCIPAWEDLQLEYLVASKAQCHGERTHPKPTDNKQLPKYFPLVCQNRTTVRVGGDKACIYPHLQPPAVNAENKDSFWSPLNNSSSFAALCCHTLKSSDPLAPRWHLSSRLSLKVIAPSAASGPGSSTLKSRGHLPQLSGYQSHTLTVYKILRFHKLERI